MGPAVLRDHPNVLIQRRAQGMLGPPSWNCSESDETRIIDTASEEHVRLSHRASLVSLPVENAVHPREAVLPSTL